MVLVNSNEGKRDKGDNMDDMKKRAQMQEFANINYVLDQNSALADVFGARTTPHVFLFNKDMKLAYKGAIDDSNESPEKVTQPWLKNAIGNVAQGKAAEPAESRPMGCSIKRVVKN
jgi:protein-disulfide isomerase